MNSKIKEEKAQAEMLRVDRDRLQEKLDMLVAAKDKEIQAYKGFLTACDRKANLYRSMVPSLAKTNNETGVHLLPTFYS